MNWKSIEQYPVKNRAAVLLRVDYKVKSVCYAVGFVKDGCVCWYNAMEGDSGSICRLADIGKGCIEAVYFIDPKEILK